MLNKKINKKLISYSSVSKFDAAYPINRCDTTQCFILLSDKYGNKHTFEINFYLLNKTFDPNKKSVVFFHGNMGFDGFGLACDDSNYFCVEYIPYLSRFTELLKDFDVNVELMVEQCTQSVEHLNKLLAQNKFYGKFYNPAEHLVFVGHSMGTIIATKVASNLSKKACNVNAIINFCSPVNMHFASKYYFKKSFSKLSFSKLSITTGILVCYILIYLISLCAFHKYKNSIGEAAKLALIISSIVMITLMIIAVSLLTLFYFESEKVGILKEDLDGIKNIPTYFIEFEGDELVWSMKSHKKILDYCIKNDLEKKVIFIKFKCNNEKDGNNNVAPDTKHYIAHTLVYKECEISKILALCSSMTLREVEGEYQICGDAQKKTMLQCYSSIALCSSMTLREVEGEYQICGDAQKKTMLQCCSSISINGKNIQRIY